MNDDLPSMSIVVIGRNEGERLVRCLESVRAADYPSERIELIYVDSDSTDDSCAVAERFGAKVIRIKPDRPCAAAGRNAGLRAVSHELVHFLDGDTILNPPWLRKAVQAIADPTVACVFGRREEMSPQATIYNFWAHYDWYVPPGPAASCAGDALFKREALTWAGGFDESLIAGEEPDLCYRIRSGRGLTILSLDEPMTQHDMNMTRFGQYWKRCMRSGHAYAEVGRRHPGLGTWRRARWRNLLYAGGLPAVGVLSIVSRSWWPLAFAVAWVTLAITRNAIRWHKQVGSMRGAVLYSSHHYLCKFPAALGQCSYWLRSSFHRPPQPLIEYR